MERVRVCMNAITITTTTMSLNYIEEYILYHPRLKRRIIMLIGY